MLISSTKCCGSRSYWPMPKALAHLWCNIIFCFPIILLVPIFSTVLRVAVSLEVLIPYLACLSAQRGGAFLFWGLVHVCGLWRILAGSSPWLFSWLLTSRRSAKILDLTGRWKGDFPHRQQNPWLWNPASSLLRFFFSEKSHLLVWLNLHILFYHFSSTASNLT